MSTSTTAQAVAKRATVGVVLLLVALAFTASATKAANPSPSFTPSEQPKIDCNASPQGCIAAPLGSDKSLLKSQLLFRTYKEQFSTSPEFDGVTLRIPQTRVFGFAKLELGKQAKRKVWVRTKLTMGTNWAAKVSCRYVITDKPQNTVVSKWQTQSLQATKPYQWKTLTFESTGSHTLGGIGGTALVSVYCTAVQEIPDGTPSGSLWGDPTGVWIYGIDAALSVYTP